MIRVLSCLLLFDVGAQALGGGAFGVIVSGIVALAANRAWKRQQQAERAARHRQSVIADEDLRLEVRERRAKP
jgi:hypothetical protein